MTSEKTQRGERIGSADLAVYGAWDASVRWFHWINVLSVIGLVAVGVVILNAKLLGVTDDGMVLLKTVHVWIGYVFALNLLWRLVWAFIGGPGARWRSFLPGGRGYVAEARRYIADFIAGRPRQYLGHNPLGRIAVTLLLLLMVIQAATGLVLAGTDIFYPPFGGLIAEWVAATGVPPDTLVPYTPALYDEAAWEAMRNFRKPIITVHYYNFYALITVIVIHILAVVVTEVREGGNLISAMFTGKKLLSKPPSDFARSDD
ncbi:MAG: cytochrome b/b6 domain-containing protein [Thiogranum sp.]|nr:cytochrome b/b6 domain-containing protein [Thiogranum sp.]